MTVPQAEMLIGLGQTVVLECRVTGVPHPDVMWYKGQQTFLPQNIVEIVNLITVGFKPYVCVLFR